MMFSCEEFRLGAWDYYDKIDHHEIPSTQQVDERTQDYKNVGKEPRPSDPAP